MEGHFNRAFSSPLASPESRGAFGREPWTARHYPAMKAEWGAKARTVGKWINERVSRGGSNG